MTTLVRTEPFRQPAGAPVGGQYATSLRPEPALSLVSEDASHADEAINELPTEQLMVVARAAVRTYAFKTGVKFAGEDDMVQDTLAAVLLNKRNNGRVVVTRPYVRSVAAGIVAHAVRGRLRAEDRKAIGIFTKDVTVLETELGRNLTGAEKDQVAANIRESWPDPRHRPSANFVALAQVRVLSLDTPASGTGERTLADTVSDSSSFSTDMNADDLSVEPDTKVGEVLSGVRANKAQNKADAWEMYAGLTGLPAATGGHVTPRAATAARLAMGAGVCAAARQWQQGETTAATAALFAPFKDAGDGVRDDIAQALVGNQYAEELWNAALSASSRRPR